MAGFSIGIASETRAFKQGIDAGVIKPLENAQDALSDLGKDRGLDQLEGSLKDAQRATDNLGDEVKQTAATIEREFKDSYRKMKQASDDGMHGAKDGLDDFKSEANSTAKETAASFDGSFDSITGMAQEVAANAFAGFGPAGAAAGLLAAGGIGLATAAFGAVDEANEKSREAAAEWADSYIEAGGRILDSAQILAKVHEIATDPEKYKKAEENAKHWGTSVSAAMLAMSGDANALGEATDGLKKKQQELADTKVYSSRDRDRVMDMKSAVDAGKASMDELNRAQGQGKAIADAYSESLRLTAERTAGATKKVDEFGDTIYTLPNGHEIYIDAQTGQATDNVDAIKNRVYSIPAEATIKVKADTSAFDRDMNNAINNAYNVNVTANVRSGRPLY
ncbi:MAG TPA: hypothetical protein VFU07_09660 [Candidatus Lumbricidophila sp.]|nr:hypothetical protein [Candidatus Lumbricidophila sp.]